MIAKVKSLRVRDLKEGDLFRIDACWYRMLAERKVLQIGAGTVELDSKTRITELSVLHKK